MGRKRQEMTQRYLIDLMLQIRGYATDLSCKIGEIERTMDRESSSEALSILFEVNKHLFEADDMLREIMSRTEKKY